jgi:excisionase family DNA binding protein
MKKTNPPGLTEAVPPNRAARRRPVTTGDLIAQRRLYPVAEAAELLGVHRVTLYHRAGKGLITILRIGGRAYVAADEIERYIRDAQPVQVTTRQAG